MPITPLPSLDRTSPTFRTEVDTFFSTQLPTFSTEINGEIVRINNIGYGSYNATSTSSLSIGTGSKSLTVETARGFAIGQAVMIASTVNPSDYMIGQVTNYDSNTGALVVNVSQSNGSATLSAWTISVTALDGDNAPTVLQRTITSTDTLIAADQGKLINASGTFTLAVTAAATLGNGWYCYVRNTGTGTITLDPNGAETVDGVTSGPVRDTILLVCNGTGFTASKVGPFSNMEVLTSGTSWTCPLGVRRARVRVQGGGGAGGKSGDSYHPGYPGAGGGYCEGLYPVAPGTEYTYAIGAAGAEASTGVSGGAGGSTTITINSTTLTANGGAGGAGATVSGPSDGGTATNAHLNISGQAGSINFTPAGITNAYNGTKGGSSILGMGGVSHGNTASVATGYGGGGAGTISSSPNAGTTGVIILEY